MKNKNNIIIYIMTTELNQIINLVKSKNEKIENISHIKKLIN